MTALVTGAAGGIGGAGMSALQADGHHVIAVDTDHVGGDVTLVQGDLRHSDTIERVAQALSGVQSLDAVVVAHGIEGAGAIHEIGEQDARAIMENNFESVIRLWDAVRTPLEAAGGSFIAIASQAAVIAEQGNALYCASKSSLRGWLRGLEAQTTARLRVLNPGGIQTELLRRALGGMAVARGTTYEKFVVDRYADTPAGRIAEPVEAGDAIRWAARLRTNELVEMTITGGEVLW